MEPANQFINMEEMWIRQAADGDLDAFNQLVLKHQDLAYRHALLILNDDWIAEEIVQDSFIKAFQGINSFRGNSFRAWLMRITTNTAYDWLRRSAKRQTRPLFPEGDDGEEIESPAWLADPNAFVEHDVERREESELIFRTLNEIQDNFRNVLTLIDLQGFDYEETAQALKIPIGTVKSRLARARFQMRQMLKGGMRKEYTTAASTLAV